jgi:tRNA A37 threonylcarbamoyladenosine biosynthesis protein TsaE
MDLYRLSPRELENFVFEEYLDDTNVTVIEWADRAKQRWPSDVLEIQFRSPTPTTRKIQIVFPPTWQKARRTALLLGQHA